MNTTEAKQYTFDAKPLVEVPTVIPTTSFVIDEAMFDEFMDRARGKYQNASPLAVVNYTDGVVRGSNPFVAVLFNEIVQEQGWHVATPAEMELNLRTGDKLGITGNHYVDMALVLRSEADPNSYLAGKLAEQLKARESKGRLNFPYMIPLAGLELAVDTATPLGLSFVLGENAQIYSNLKILNKGDSFKSEDVDPQTGIPTKVGEGSRTLYTINSGLSRLSLGRNLDLNARDEDLANSSGDGRVVVVRNGAEGAARDYGAFLTREVAEQRRKIDEKLARARAELRK